MVADSLATALPPAAAAFDRSVASYIGAFSPAPEWEEIVSWPPDVFAVANLVLDHTESYRFVVAPPLGRRWPVLPGWSEQVRAAAREWRETGSPPPFVRRCWDRVTRDRELTLADVRSGEAWDLTSGLLTLHALADEACAGLAPRGGRAPTEFEARARSLLSERGSLSRFSSTRIRIVPKTHFSSRGITIRSLSRYLALCYESVDVRWRGLEPGASPIKADYNAVLVPWPLAVSARDFRPAPPALLDNMDTEVFGFFEFDPEPSLDPEALGSLLATAVERAGSADAVILPEVAVRPGELPGLERALARHGATLLVAGVRQPASGSAFGRNYLHFGIRTPAGWSRYEQDKHHRWCLDEGQLRQYHLTRSLDPGKQWWEAIDIRERALHIVEVGGGVTAAPLVCEDLARLDEVADLVRRIGPSLVIALLLDGPQLASRWPSRYASVIADDPGSAVLTLTSAGMVARSCPAGTRRSRVVAQWNSRADGLHELELPRGADALLLSTSVDTATLWTADGRRHANVPRLRLSNVHPLRSRQRLRPA